MPGKEGRDYLYLIWKDPISRRNFIVGELSKNSLYEFSYGHEIKEAIKKGFEPLISFDKIDKTYKRDILFPTFSSRLPDSKRRGIEAILAKYGLSEYDEYELLKKSGARLPIDSLEFIDPIPEEHNGKIRKTFYIAGTRYYMGCDGSDCDKALNLEVGDELSLEFDPTNKYDKNAIKILDSKKNCIGYLPRYYSEGVVKHLRNRTTYKCKVIEVNKDRKCQECIKVELKINSGAKEIGYINNARKMVVNI